MNTIGIVLARCGSKEIPYKNIVSVNGKPLIFYILTALSKSNVDSYYVSTDCYEIANICSFYGASIINRPKELAKDNSSSKDALIHAVLSLDNLKSDTNILLLQPTSPLILPSDINNAIDQLSTYDSVLSVTKGNPFIWLYEDNSLIEKNEKLCDRKPRQYYNNFFVETGGIYGTKYHLLLKTEKILSGRIGYVDIPKSRSFEIDSYDDIFIIESIMNKVDT